MMSDTNYFNECPPVMQARILQMEADLAAEREAREKAEDNFRRAVDARQLHYDRAEAAEQKLREAQEQEPVYYYAKCDDVDRSALCYHLADAQTLVNDYEGEVEILYAAPIPPEDIAELQRDINAIAKQRDDLMQDNLRMVEENAELTRKLAEK